MKIYLNNTFINHFNDAIKRNYVKYNNLAPLQQDTVSFGQGGDQVNGKNMASAPRLRACKDLNKYAEPAKYLLEETLNKYLEPLLQKDSRQKPKIKLSTRIKSPISIKQKVSTKRNSKLREEGREFARRVTYELSKYFPSLEGCSDDDWYGIIMNTDEYTNAIESLSAFHNSRSMLNIIVDSLDRAKAINLNKKSPEERLNIFNGLAKKLANTPPNNSDNNFKYSENTSSLDGIKYYSKDIIGARINLMDKSPKTVERVINAIYKAVEDDYLHVTSIECFYPDPKKIPPGKTPRDYLYMDEYKMRSYAAKMGADLITNTSNSGYMAIHVNVDLSNPIFNKASKWTKKSGKDKSNFNGYFAEIQIMDSDIETLKDVEDVYYKFKDKKSDSADGYGMLRKHISEYCKGDAKKYFNDYTYKLYLAQRLKSPADKRTDFPSIQELGFDSKVPENLDFNYLKKIKEVCDYNAKIQTKNSDVIYDKELESAIKHTKDEIRGKYFTN